MAAATMATTAILKPNSFKSTPNSNPKPYAFTPLTKPTISLPKTLVSSPLTTTTTTALAGAFFSALASSEPAFAAQQIAQIAERADDNRGLALLLPIIPAIGWVLFNILQPALNQLNRMRSQNSAVVGLGLGGLLWAAASAPTADAAEAAAAAGGDNRGTLLLIVILPAIGWVLFNIFQPALNQLNRMRSE